VRYRGKTMKISVVRSFAVVLLLLTIGSFIPAVAQNTGTGTPPFGSFTGGTPYDVVNNQNLNVHFSLSL